MKIRNGFVSNSSSASFIITMKTSLTNDEISDLIKLSDENLEKHWDGGTDYNWDFDAIAGSGKPINQWPVKQVEVDPKKNKVLKRIDTSTIEVHCDTTMFNDWMDVPAWKFIRAVSESKLSGLKLEKILQTEEEYTVTNIETSFDSRVWEYECKDESESDMSRYLTRQNKIEREYQSYLIRIGYIPTEEEIVEFAKNQLNH